MKIKFDDFINRRDGDVSQVFKQEPINKNKKLVDGISRLNPVTEEGIIKLVCDYGLSYEDRDGYGEWNKYIVDRSEESMFQTPKQIADAILELLKYKINSFAEVGVWKGGTHILMKYLLKKKNPGLKAIGIDFQNKLTPEAQQYIDLKVATSDDFEGEKFDLVFIDADHSYQGVSTDYYNLGQYAKIVMFHDINDSKCPGVVRFWNEIKEGKKHKEFLYQTNNQRIHGIGILFNEDVLVSDKLVESKIQKLEYPMVRHFVYYDSAISIIQDGYLMSRKELKNNIENLSEDIVKNKGLESSNSWWRERVEQDIKNFGTENLIFCIPDWFNNSGYITGHGPVMIYFKPKIFEDFKVTFTVLDSLTNIKLDIYDKYDLSKIYSNIINEKYYYEYDKVSKQILTNLEYKNEGRTFRTSRGQVFIEGGRFNQKYSEVQIHTNKIPIEYIQEIRFTDNYLHVSNTDNENKEKLISLCKEKKISIVI